jgi:hypothetical protein
MVRRFSLRKPMSNQEECLAALEMTGVQDGAEGQARFCDFNVRSRKTLKEKLDFFTRDREAVNMHANPAIRGRVKHPRDWPWSSWGFYVNGESGLVKIDRMD